MHTISHTIVKTTGLCPTNRCVKICVLLFAALLSIAIGGCKKEGFTRLMDVEMKIKVVPDAERVRIGDTVKIIAWLPYKQFDRGANSMVDIRGMEVQSWGSLGYKGLDTFFTVVQGNISVGKFETFFDVQHPFGTFKEYPKNHVIGTMHQNDTAFYFQLNLVAQKRGVFMIWPSVGRGFLDKGRFRIDIAAKIINKNYHQYLSHKYMPGITPYDKDYFFETH